MNARFLSLARMTAVAAAAMACGTAAAGFIESSLSRQMASAKAQDQLTVVITFRQRGPVTPLQVVSLQAMGLKRGVTMRALPIMGAVATPALIREIAKRPDVVSVVRNAPLRFFNYDQSRSSGARRVQESPGDFLRGIPFSGKGVTVQVLDSGVDATNLDLPMGTKLVDNVMAVPAAGLALADSLIGPGIVPVVFLQNQQNTDLSSGHGTHVAGTIGGTGQQSKSKHRGAAPGADLLGYGTGAAISILNAVVGLDYALANKNSYRFPIRVTSNSWGTSADAFLPEEYCGQPVNVATYELAKQDIVTVFAAGNDGPSDNTHNPYARAPWVISVGAGEKDGVLTSFSSRGERDAQFDCTMHDGTKVTFRNEPTIVASGVNIISTRAYTGALPALAAQTDAELLTPQELPFYTLSSGTSMATPHVSGVVALMLEANPKLTAAQVKDVIQKTATNMTGRARHEVGAGHLNAYAAVAMAQGMAQGKTLAYGGTVKTLKFAANGVAAPTDRAFNGQQVLKAGLTEDVPLTYAPAGANTGHAFDVAADVLQVTARLNTVGGAGVELVDPTGAVHGSSIALPVLGETVIASAPGKVGKWTLRMKGLRSYGGTQVAPPDSNGVGVPGSYTVQLSRTLNGGYTGLNDITSHPKKNAIEYAVGVRMVDSESSGNFGPDQALTRGKLAEWLVMGASLRQSLPFNNLNPRSGLPASDPLFATAEIVTSRGAVLRDLTHLQNPLIPLASRQVFDRNANVTQLELAYVLVQALALQPSALAFNSDITVMDGAAVVPVSVVGVDGQPFALSAAQKGYVHLALNLGLLKTVKSADGTKQLFVANRLVTRADYAEAAGVFQAQYQRGEDGL